MPQGDQIRTIGIKAAAKANNLDITYIEAPKTPEHFSVSKLGKVPAFKGEDGTVLFEAIAIAIYGSFFFLFLVRVVSGCGGRVGRWG